MIEAPNGSKLTPVEIAKLRFEGISDEQLTFVTPKFIREIYASELSHLDTFFVAEFLKIQESMEAEVTEWMMAKLDETSSEASKEIASRMEYAVWVTYGRVESSFAESLYKYSRATTFPKSSAFFSRVLTALQMTPKDLEPGSSTWDDYVFSTQALIELMDFLPKESKGL